MNENKIISLSEKSDKSDLWTMEEMLKYNIGKISERTGTKAIVIYLDDTEGKYITSTSSAGFHKTSEIVSLLEVLKMQTVSEDMNCI